MQELSKAPTRQERAQMKRIRQAFFRAMQTVNGEFTRRYEECRRLKNQPGYTGDGFEAFDGVDMDTWRENAMRAAVGPAYDALKQVVEGCDGTM